MRLLGGFGLPWECTYDLHIVLHFQATSGAVDFIEFFRSSNSFIEVCLTVTSSKESPFRMALIELHSWIRPSGIIGCLAMKSCSQNRGFTSVWGGVSGVDPGPMIQVNTHRLTLFTTMFLQISGIRGVFALRFFCSGYSTDLGGECAGTLRADR